MREIDVVAGDIRDVESVAGALASREVVFHLAAQIAIPYSYVNPRDFFETNVLGTFNVAESARSSGARRVIHASTSEVYGSARVIPIDELHPLEPQSPYAASKLAADKLMDSYHRAYDLPVTVVRPFNTFGPFQSARAIVPTILTQALAGDRLRLGSLDPRRDLTYVSDTVDGFIAAAASEAATAARCNWAPGSPSRSGSSSSSWPRSSGASWRSSTIRRGCDPSTARSCTSSRAPGARSI